MHTEFQGHPSCKRLFHHAGRQVSTHPCITQGWGWGGWTASSRQIYKVQSLKRSRGWEHEEWGNQTLTHIRGLWRALRSECRLGWVA